MNENMLQKNTGGISQLDCARSALANLSRDLSDREKNLREDIEACDVRLRGLDEIIGKMPEATPVWKQILGMGPEKTWQKCYENREVLAKELRSIPVIRIHITTVALAIENARANEVSASALSNAIMLYASKCLESGIEDKDRQSQWRKVEAALEVVMERSNELSKTLLVREVNETERLKREGDASAETKESDARVKKEKALQEAIKTKRDAQQAEISLAESQKIAEARARRYAAQSENAAIRADDLRRESNYNRKGIFGKLGTIIFGE
jgi:hypothetical protein